jgi:N-acetylglucosaminyl-diphospho-decaprenol L-rhamnosyltransferase
LTLPSVDVVIVNWNSGAHLVKCLESIAAARQSTFELRRVVVVDNASSDTSLAGITDIPLPLRVLGNTENRGFAAACNEGAREVDGDFLLFLNPDTRLSVETLDIVTAFMADPTNARIGISGGRMVGTDAAPASSCSRFPTLSTSLSHMVGLARLFPQFPSHLIDPDVNTVVDQVIGAFFFVRRSVFDELGGFDERFFVYMEDVDFAYRAKECGYASFFLSDVRIHHHGHVSSDQVRGRRMFYMLRSRSEYARKHWPSWQAFLLALLQLIVELPARAAVGAARRQPVEIREVVEAARLYARYMLGDRLSILR